MYVIGVDAHRRMVYAVAVDERGQEVGYWHGRNTAAQWAAALVWAEDLSEAASAGRHWGIEGSANQGRGLAQLLVGQGEVVCEVNPRWTAAARSRSRRRDKTDHEDACAIARLLLQEGATLPRVNPEDATTPLAILTRERDTLQADLTRNRNRVHAELLRLDPDYVCTVPDLTNRANLETILAWDETRLGVSAQIQLQTIQRRVRRLLALCDDLDTVSAHLQTLSRPVARPLTTIFGVGELTAGMLAGYLGPGDRFATDAQLARYAGVAPVEASSAGQTRHRLNRTGHRKLNAVIHRIALTQSQRYAPAKQYLARRQADGKTWREALRALKRHIARAIWRAWQQCLTGTASPTNVAHAASPLT